MRTLIRVILLAALGAVSGCPPRGNVMPAPHALVVKIEMQVRPKAFDWDGRPGVDGLQTRVRLYRDDPVRAVPVSGVLEFLLFEGRVRAEDILAAKPLRTWSFVGEVLQRHANRDIVGWNYMLRLAWDLDVPKSDSVTLIVRYKLPDGRWLYSEPNSSITVPQGGGDEGDPANADP